MRLRSLALFPLIYAAVLLVLYWLLGDGAAGELLVDGQDLLARLLAVVGCLSAVSAFEPGDELRRAWLLVGVAMIAFFVRGSLSRLPSFQRAQAGPMEVAVVTGLLLLSNFAFLGGIWLLARSGRMAAPSLPGGRAGMVGVTLVSAVLALSVAGFSAREQALALWSGQADWHGIVLLVSVIVNTLALCLVAPLLLTAVSLRGGLFAWPWALLTASLFTWLLCDAAVALGRPTPAGLPLTDGLLGLASNLLFAAGLAQRLVVRQVGERLGRRAAA